MSSATVLIVQVIGMLPDVEGQQRLQTLHHRIRRPWLLRDYQVAISISRQPYPARAEQSYALSLKLSFESLHTTPLLLYLCSKCSLRTLSGLTDRFKLQKIQLVVQYLSCIVKYRPFTMKNKLFKHLELSMTPLSYRRGVWG